MAKIFGLSKYHLFFSVIVFSLVFSGCYTYSIKENGFINRAFPVPGDILEQGSIGILKQDISPLFSIPIGKTKPPETDIALVGYLQENTPGKIMLFNFKSLNEDEADVVIIDGYRWHYRWTGSLTMDNQTSELTFAFNGYDTNDDGYHLNFELETIKKQDHIELNHILDDHVIPSIPYRLGSFYIGGIRYPLYIVLEYEYEIESSMPKEDIIKQTPYLLKDEKSMYNIVFRRDQKFQIVNELNQGVADIQGDAYTLYHTLPVSAKPGMKRLIAQMYTFIRIARQLHQGTDTRDEAALISSWKSK
jgi:hypothetical protein